MLMSVNVCISHQNQGSFIAQETIMCCHYNDRHIMGNGHILEWCLFASPPSVVLVSYLYLWGGPQRPLGVETYIGRLPVLTWRTLCAHPMQHTTAHTNATHNCTHICTAPFFPVQMPVLCIKRLYNFLCTQDRVFQFFWDMTSAVLWTGWELCLQECSKTTPKFRVLDLVFSRFYTLKEPSIVKRFLVQLEFKTNCWFALFLCFLWVSAVRSFALFHCGLF